MSGAIEVGRVCIKTKGRKAGKIVAIVDYGKEFASVEGENVKGKKCNIRHLFPLEEKIAIKKGAKNDEVVKLIKKVK